MSLLDPDVRWDQIVNIENKEMCFKDKGGIHSRLIHPSGRKVKIKFCKRSTTKFLFGTISGCL